MTVTVRQPIVERKERRSLPDRPCGVCARGVYVTKMETDSYAGRGVLQRFGVDSREEGLLWRVEACDRCGHVQIFRQDWRRVG